MRNVSPKPFNPTGSEYFDTLTSAMMDKHSMTRGSKQSMGESSLPAKGTKKKFYKFLVQIIFLFTVHVIYMINVCETVWSHTFLFNTW